MRRAVGIVVALVFVSSAGQGEDLLLKDSSVFAVGNAMKPSEVPARILFRDSTLVISAGGPNTDYRDLSIIPYQDIRTMEYGEFRQGNEGAAILISPLFALHFSQKRLFSLSYMAPDSVRVLNIFLAGKDKEPFIQEIEKRTGKKTVTSFVEAPTFTNFKILLSDKHDNFSQAPVSVVVRDTSLLVFGSDPNNTYQDRIMIPFRNIQSISSRIRKERGSNWGFVFTPLFFLNSKMPILSIIYAGDTTKSVVLVLNEDEKDKFIEVIEKKTGKKVDGEPENIVTTKASQTDLKVTVPVTSEPLGADIYVDEMFRGSTPSTISFVPGDHSIRITRPGYITWERMVQIEPSGSITLNAVLEKERPKQ